MRRRAPAPAAEDPEPPEELITCYVEDWVGPQEEQSPWSHPAPWEWWAELAARRRFRDAQAEWMDASGIPRGRWPQLFTWHWPRWRNGRAPDPTRH